MGLTYTEIHELLGARRRGAAFTATLTVGRQNLFLRPRETASLVAEFGLPEAATAAAEPFGAYADAFVRSALGVQRLESLDASSYEDATLVHDLNRPVPAHLVQSFDAVVDGGSLEHIFNVPVALANVMRMTRVGGLVVLSNPANNLCGHGFFQFSPELMFRIFNPRHGFTVERIAIVEARFPGIELAPRRRPFDVVDPERVGERVSLVSRRPVMLLTRARKLEHRDDPFAVAPHQSDYAVLWRTGHREGRHSLRRVPPSVRARLRGYRQRARYSLRNRRFYVKA